MGQEAPSAPKIRLGDKVTAVTLGSKQWLELPVLEWIGLKCSGSMLPIFDCGVKLGVLKIPYSDLKVGDLALIRVDKDTLLFHRVAEKSDTGFRTQGLAQQYMDKDVWKPEQLHGVAVVVIY